MTATRADDSRLRALLDAAATAQRSGRHDDAARTWEAVLAAAPDNAKALNYLAMRALAGGNAAGAREMLKRAVASDPRSPQLQVNLALACRALNDADAERAALEQALVLEPRFYLALLQKAALLEREGRFKSAARIYGNALACLPPVAQVPRALHPAIAHAHNAVRANNAALEAFLRDRLGEVRARHGAQQRFDHCLDVILGKRRVYVQQPTAVHFPRLPAIEFYDREESPWLQAVETATDDMHREVMQALAADAGQFIPYIDYADGLPLDQWKELNRSPQWSAFYLWRDGARLDEHCARCPVTAATLTAAPMASIPGRAPTAFFSLLRPKTRIPPHTGVTNTRLVVHLPLIVPPSCGFRVGSEVREWRPGQAWVFDDTIEHEAWNDSDEARVILIFDIWNPFLTAAERELTTEATRGIADFYEGDSPLAGGL